MHNLLTERVIRIDTDSTPALRATLPETYALLMQDQVRAFPALRSHRFPRTRGDRPQPGERLCRRGQVPPHTRG